MKKAAIVNKIRDKNVITGLFLFHHQNKQTNKQKTQLNFQAFLKPMFLQYTECFRFERSVKSILEYLEIYEYCEEHMKLGFYVSYETYIKKILLL